jgi:hypothetical protein
MGIEYKLRVTQADHAAVQLALSTLSCAEIPDPGSNLIEFRREDSLSDSMPDAVVQIEMDSVYFRNNGGRGDAFLGAVIAKLCCIGTVTIQEL